MSIQDWPQQERPREKLLNRGADALTDAELLAIFLRTGVVGLSAIDLARALIVEYGSLKALFGASQQQFCQTKGLGPVKYAQLQAVLEMGRRYFWEEMTAQPIMGSAEAAQKYIVSKIGHQQREVFACVFLNSQYHVEHYEEMFQGTYNQSPVFPREIAKRALQLNAAAVILAHNHPSGVAEPSGADRDITELICDALALLDIRVLDHFIVGKTKVYSFAEHGIL
ncbi:MAG: DNA repair protein RadC [Pseudomonadales bacterium]|nr:DNA repair protein RadC [Pseudomonadales bacterium]